MLQTKQDVEFEPDRGFIRLGQETKSFDVDNSIKLVGEDDAALKALLDNSAAKLTNGENSFLWLLVYLDYKVFWGCYRNGQFEFVGNKLESRYLQELRLFGQKGELYLWRKGHGFKGRLLIDPLIEPEYPKKPDTKESDKDKRGYDLPNDLALAANYADEWLVLWGTKFDDSKTAGWTTITEDRGMKLTLPHIIGAEADLPLRLLVRHYLDYDANGLCYYKDTRLVEARNNKFEQL